MWSEEARNLHRVAVHFHVFSFYSKLGVSLCLVSLLSRFLVTCVTLLYKHNSWYWYAFLVFWTLIVSVQFSFNIVRGILGRYITRGIKNIRSLTQLTTRYTIFCHFSSLSFATEKCTWCRVSPKLWLRCRRIVVLGLLACHLPCRQHPHRRKLCVLSWIISVCETNTSHLEPGQCTWSHVNSNTGCHQKCRLWTTPSPPYSPFVLHGKWLAGRPRTTILPYIVVYLYFFILSIVCLLMCVNAVGLPVFNHVLTPRSKGLWLCTERLHSCTDAFYDVTIAYANRDQSTFDENSTFHPAAPTLGGMLTSQQCICWYTSVKVKIKVKCGFVWRLVVWSHL